MIRALIIDDEQPARQILEHMLKDFTELEVIGEAENGFDAAKKINELKPELIFLDIQMPKISGFELLELLEDPPAVIFVTAYDEFAIEAFENGALDYLLKPINKERLMKAMQRVGRSLNKDQLAQLSDNIREAKAPLHQVVVKDGHKITVLPCEEIEFFKAEDDYVSIHSTQGKYLKKMKISSLETSLDPEQFLRVHRSYIANVTFLKNIEKWSKDQYMGFMASGERVKISKPGYQLLKDRLNI